VSPGRETARDLLLAELRDHWDRAEPVSARTVVERHPGLTLDDSVFLDLVYEEICQRQGAGEVLDPKSFCARFPGHQRAVFELLDTHSFFANNPHLIAEPTNVSCDAEPVWPVAGESVAGFDLQLPLGRGNFGRVYLATQPTLGGRRVVVKLSSRGADEAATLGPLNHPNIVPVHSVHFDAIHNLDVVCMPYLGSATVYQVQKHIGFDPAPPARARVLLAAIGKVDRGKEPDVAALPPDPVLSSRNYADGIAHLGAQLADALAFIHARTLCHRDLKPSNILLRSDGRPMLLDFDLATTKQDTNRDLVGTWPYMAPEQLHGFQAGDAEVGPDHRSDLFALGVILYELLAGRHPFGAALERLPSHEMIPQVLAWQTKPLYSLRSLNPQVDANLERVIRRCLAVNPADRPQTAAEVATALRQALSPAYRAHRWIAGHRLFVTSSLAALFAAVLAGSGYFAVQDNTSGRPADEFPSAVQGDESEQNDELTIRLLKKGRTALGAGEFENAVGCFTQVIEAQPTNISALHARARARQQQGELARGIQMQGYFTAAILDLAQADQLAPDTRTKASLGYCFNRCHRSEVAQAKYLEAIQGGFRTAEVLNNLGYSYLEQTDRQYPEALTSLTEAIKRDPQLRAAYYNRAKVYLCLTREGVHIIHSLGFPNLGIVIQLGIADIKRAIELGEPTADLHYDAAQWYGRAAQWHRSRERCIQIVGERLAAPDAMSRLVAFQTFPDCPWIDLALDSLDSAWRKGAKPNWFSNGRDVIENNLVILANEPRFQELIKKELGADGPSATRVVDPNRESFK
jgi:serine/threonine protein kinase/Flp pilus assembly protein TadD